jgi:nitrite reductase (NADH) small subunit
MVRACAVADVPVGERREVTISGRSVALFRSRSGWYALDNRCPQMGGPLTDGCVPDCSVMCPLHERRFDPARGEALPTGRGVTAHRVTILVGEVFVSLGASSAEAGALSA